MIESTNAIGLISKSGRYSGTYAHKDIAFEFATWISPKFKLLLIKEYQLLKEKDSHQHNYVIPKFFFTARKQGIEYSQEAVLVNIAAFGFTSKEWKNSNSQAILRGENIRDYASIDQLNVLANIEFYNSELIKQGLSRNERETLLNNKATKSLEILEKKIKITIICLLKIDKNYQILMLT